MKIGISFTGNTPDSIMDPRFGRTALFIVVDPDTMNFEVIDNEAPSLAGGAGVSSAQAMVEKGVSA